MRRAARTAFRVFEEALAVVDCRAAQAERFAINFAAIVERRQAVGRDEAHASVFEAPSGATDDAWVVRFKPDKTGTVGDERVAERAGEVLSVADRAEFRIADAARREEDVFCPQGEVFRRDDEAVFLRLDARHGTVREDGHVVVAQEVAEGVDDRCRLAVRREHPRVRHAPQRDIERLETGDNFARRTFANRLRDETGARPDVAEEFVGRNVFCEVAASVRRHENLRAEPCLALDDDAGDLALRRDGGGEHAGGTAAYDRQFYGCMFQSHNEWYFIIFAKSVGRRGQCVG